MNRVALVIARGGSKRIPGKNTRMFRGQPMIAWPLQAAQEAGVFDRIIVSTDDTSTAVLARHYGAEVPFERPAALADDHTTTADVARHALRWLEDEGQMPDTLCCIYGAAPFTRADDLRAGAQRLLEGWSFVVPVTDYGHPIQRALRRTEDGGVEMIQPENLLVRTQDLEPAYHDTGQWYWAWSTAWLNLSVPIFGPRTCALILPRHSVQDIDTPDDWARAAWIHEMLERDA